MISVWTVVSVLWPAERQGGNADRLEASRA